MGTISGSMTYPKGVGTWVRDCSDIADCRIVVNNEIEYDCSYCGDFAVYYTNKFGGWDSFLFEGLCKRTDNLNEYKYNRAFNNQTIDFENNRYLVEVNPSYELNTGWMSDEEAERFAANLIPSTKMYLHNLKEDKIVPAVIKDTQAEYKTFKNNGRKLVSYKVTVEESQTKIRR